MPKKAPQQMFSDNIEGSNLMKGLAKKKCYQGGPTCNSSMFT